VSHLGSWAGITPEPEIELCPDTRSREFDLWSEGKLCRRSGLD